MAGHSKWANIKHKKERADAQKGKLFSRLAKEIISAVKVAGPDPRSNARLRLAIARAKAGNLPTESIERNIKRGSAADQADYEEVIYELYGYGGVGILVDAMTDNKNRSASDIRTVIGKRGGVLAGPGAVAFNFDRRGVIHIESATLAAETLFEKATLAGAEDFEIAEEGYFVITEPHVLYTVKEALESEGIIASSADLTLIPKHVVSVSSEDRAANEALLGALEVLDDVNEVYHNMENPSL